METTEDKRQEILKRLNIVEQQRSAVQDELKAFDHADRFAQANIHVGKYYKEPNKHHDNHIRCVFVHGINSESCELDSMEISYWKDQNYWYGIEYYNNFKLRGYDDDEDKFVEITKEEFMEHYAQVVKRIELVIPQTINPLPSVDEAGVIAVGISEQLDAREQSFFIAGFQECIKYLTR